MSNFLVGKKPLFFLALYFSDVVMLLVSMFLAYAIFNSQSAVMLDFYFRIGFFSLLILVVNYSAFGLYDERRNLFDENQVMNLVYSIAITYMIILTFLILFWEQALIIQVSLAFLFTLITTLASRIVMYNLIYNFRKAGYDMKRVMFFGKPNEDIITRIKENAALGYKFVKQTEIIDELKKHLKDIDVVFVTEEKISESLMELIIENSSVTWKIIPSAFNLIMDRINFDEFKDYPVINIPSAGFNASYLKIKRIMDIVLSGLSLIALSPLFLLIAFLIKLTMPGPVFYKHERMGKYQKPFMLYKFRTMVVNADKIKSSLKNEVHGLFKMKDDPRVTPLGYVLRRSCVDELPQLINIFRGDMSIVGPRPHLREEVHFYKGWRQTRFQVKPGLTGMWQVSGRHELNFDKAVLYDIYYIKHMSLILDIAIIMKTLPSIVFSKGRY